MPRLNLYEQQTSAQGPRASGADFGAAPAQALEGAGNALYEIGQRVQRREELLAADQVMTDVDTWALTALDDFSKRPDITSQQSLPEFQNALKQKRAEALSKFSGRPEARAALERQLDNQLSQYGKSAISTKIKVGHNLMTRSIDQQLDKTANQVGVAPQIMEDAIAENVAYVNSRKDAMSADLYQAALTKAQAAPIQAAVQAHIQSGSWDAAETLMADPRFSKLLGPEVVRPLRIDVAVGRGKAEAETVRQNQNVAKFTMRFGRPLTPDEEIKARSLPAKKDMTPADEITELELVQGKPASQDQVDKIYKTYVDGGSGDSQFGNSIRGKSVDYVTKNAVRYSQGLMTPDEARVFEASMVEAYSPVKITDPLTGVITTREVTMPAFVKEAVNRGSSFFGGSAAPSPRPGDTVRLDINGQVIGTGQVDSTGRWSIPAPPEGAGAGRGSQGVPTGDAPTATPAPLPGLYDNVPFVAGPTAKLGQVMNRTPLIGDNFNLGKYGEAQKAMDIGKEQLSQALRPNSKIADTYRQELMKLVDITGKSWDNPQAMWRDIQVIDKELRTKLTQLENIASGKTAAPIEDRKDALDISNAIRFSLQRLDVPQVKVTTKEEYDKLAPGTRYLFGDDPKPLKKK